ncbi:TRIC cation channel family protein, partial [Psychrobacter sp. 16-Bac2893]
AAFSVIGFKVGLTQDIAPMIAIMMGVWTAIIGGLLRDIICNEIPLVLQREIYITASIAGSLAYVVLDYWGLDATINEFIMLFIIFAIRMLALKFDWHLPSIRLID